MIKKNVKKRAKEAMEKYKQDKEKVSNDNPFSTKQSVPKPAGGFTARPDKKRG